MFKQANTNYIILYEFLSKYNEITTCSWFDICIWIHLNVQIAYCTKPGIIFLLPKLSWLEQGLHKIISENRNYLALLIDYAGYNCYEG